MLVTLMIFSILAFCTSCIAVGYWYLTRQKLQGDLFEAKLLKETLEQDRKKAQEAAEQLAGLHNSSQARFNELVEQVNTLSMKVTSATAMSQGRRGI